MSKTESETFTFDWKDTDMSTGIIAQEIASIDLSDTSITSTSDSYVLANGITNGVGTITVSGGYEYESYLTRDEFNSVVERLEKIEKVLAEEAELRASHPALKTAYDEYRLLLVLTKQHSNPVDN